MNPDPVDYDSDIPLAAALNPNTFELSLEIACESEDQIVSRPMGEGYTYKDLEGSRVVVTTHSYRNL